jgi:hypothetical protein
MSYQTLPTSILPSYSLTKIPTFRTFIVDYGNKVEQRISRDSLVRYQFKLKFDAVEISNTDILTAFFEARKGSFEAFYFLNAEEAYRENIWVKSTSYVLNQIVRPTTVNGRSYKCTQAGTSHGSTEPTWPTTTNGTVTDSGVIWKENTYLVRFVDDIINVEYFQYNLYNFGEINLTEVSA